MTGTHPSIALPPSNQTCPHSLSIIARIICRQLSQMSQHRRTSFARTALERIQSEALCQRPAFIPLKATPSFMVMQGSPQFGEDYRIYQQNIDLDSFFGEEPKYDKVSDVCLLNDHFMLVKMPQIQFQEPEKVTTAPAAPPPTKSKLPRCFKCNRSSRVSPILEELEEKPPQRSCLKPWASRDMDEVEVFDSTTTITTVPRKARRNDQNDVEVFASNTKIRFSRKSSVRGPPESVIVEQPHPQHPSVPAPHSLLPSVPAPHSQPLPVPAAHPQPTPHPQPPSIPALLQLEAIHPAALAPVAQPPLLSRGPLHWFLWPFRRRLHSKSKSQLATVHKTYFVRWSKPPDTIWHGYGVDRGDRVNKKGLRRCRSAVF